MKVAVCFFAVLACAFAFPSEPEIDNFNITPNNIYVLTAGDSPNIPSSRVIGGNPAQANQFPYQVALLINGASFCGGSIISNQWILTAAHCVDSATNVQVITGQTRWRDGQQQNRFATRAIVHEQWNRQLLQNDIALLQVPTISLSNSVATIALAGSGDFVNSDAVLSGWGRTSDASNAVATNLKFVGLRVITNTNCNIRFLGMIRDQHICTGGTSGNSVIGACNGDSGGPLVVGNVEVGVVSFGSARCESGNPTVFARVSHFRDWIRTRSGV